MNESQELMQRLMGVYEKVIADVTSLKEANAQLDKKLVSFQKALLDIIQGPMTAMKQDIAALKTAGPARVQARRGRQPLVRKDYNLVQGYLENGKPKAGSNWSAIARETGIPTSTVRKYADMSVEEADKLPAEV